MNKYFLSQILLDRFEIFSDMECIAKAIENLRKEVTNIENNHEALERILLSNINFFGGNKKWSKKD